LCSLTAGLWVPFHCTAQPQVGGAGYSHVEYKPAFKLNATLTASIDPFEGRLYFPKPREGLNQRDVVVTLRLKGERKAELPKMGVEASPFQFPVLYFEIANKPTTVEARLQATLYTRSLLPGKPTSQVPSLSAEERQLYTGLRGGSMTHNPEQLRSWINTNQLTRPAMESDVQFAFRVHKFLRDHFKYGTPATTEWAVDAVAKCGQTECFGLSRVFVAVLRSNGIPSRALPGRMINDGGTHVKAEFYAEGVGWVPVEVAGGVTDKNSPLISPVAMSCSFYGKRKSRYRIIYAIPSTRRLRRHAKNAV
jgi:transglutaminase-like putative cysteine protease